MGALCWVGGYATAQSSVSAKLIQPVVAHHSNHSYQDDTKQSLASVLEELQSRYQILFNYEPTIVEGKQVDKLPDRTTEVAVEEVLDDYLVPLQLNYRKLGEGYYIIFRSDPPRVDKVRRQSVRSERSATEPVLPTVSSGSSARLLSRGRIIRVSGTVSDAETDAPLPGVNVLVKDITKGTITDAEGRYQIEVPSSASVLVFSSIGYTAEEVMVGSQTIVNVALAPSLEQLSEVVVIGYGERERKDITGAISQIGSEEVTQSVAMTPELAMQGRLPGVFVSTPGGAPNARPQVRIRGIGTFGNAEPLYVIDGVPITEFGQGSSDNRTRDQRGNVNIFTLINPNDIESISVLKDASAAAIYGVRAANGVVLITTKKGRAGEPQVSINVSRGVQNLPNTYEVLNTAQYAQLYQEAFANNEAETGNLPTEFDTNSDSYLGNHSAYNWQNELLNQNAVIEDYGVRLSGGSEKTTYYVSGGYSRTESPLKGNQLKRYTLATDLNSHLGRMVDVGLNYKLGYVDALDNTRSNLQNTASAPPWQPIFDESDPLGYARVRDGFGDTNPFFFGPETESNVLALQRLNQTDYQVIRNLGSAFVQVEPLEGLRFKGTLSVDWYYNQRNTWVDVDEVLYNVTGRNPASYGNGTSAGEYGERHSRNFNLVKEFSINYHKSFGDHTVDVLLNAMDQHYSVNIVTGSSTQLLSDDPAVRRIPNDFPEYTRAFTDRVPYALQGYLGRFSYHYASKYYLDATVRRDGTSRFAPEFRWGTFPSLAAAWRISSEAFLQGVDFLNDLKIRGGWGQLGNQETREFAFLSTVQTQPTYALGSGNGDAEGNVITAVRLPDFPIANLSWETATTTSVGFDALLFNNRLNLTAEYYHRQTEDILQEVALPASAGNEISPVLNLATVQNRGFEFQMGYNGSLGNLQYTLSANLTTVDNEVVKIYQNQPFGGNENRIEEGFPIEYLWGWKVGGVFRDQAEVDAYQDQTSDQQAASQAPGDLYFQDVYGDPTEDEPFYSQTPDGVVNLNDRTYLGKTIPGYYYGCSLGAAYRALEVSVFFQGVGDVQRYNEARRSGENMSSQGVNQWASTLGRWTPQNTNTEMPRAVRSDPAQNARFSSRWIEDADFLRLKNFQVGYSLPTGTLEKLNFVQNFQVYLRGTNVLLFTPYSGLDPEETPGVGGDNVVPPARSFTLGLNATF